MKNFSIYGAIVDTDDQRGTFEDVIPAQFKSFAQKLEPGEELQVSINSPGGSVYGGIAIANMIRQLSKDGHRTTAFVEGLAASIASVVMCACDRVKMGESSLVMIHNCWSVVQGDSNALRKEADTMDVMNDAIVSFYRSKFDLPAETLKAMMDEETWFSGREAANFKFSCEVLPDAPGFSIAARLKDMDLGKFRRAPQNLTTGENTDMEDNEQKTEQKLEEEVQQAVEAAEVDSEKPVEEQPVEQPVEETVPKAEVEKRVSGMQSAMAKQMDAMKKDYEARITEFQVQIKAKDEELTKAKADVTSLSERLEKANGELSHATSALAEKENALAVLNAGVNTPAETTDWKSLKGKAFFDWYKKTH